VLVQEKANSHNMHPDVIAHTDATNAGNRRTSSEVKVDIISRLQKRQHNLGRMDAMIYFKQNKKIKKCTWLVIFNNDKEGRSAKARQYCTIVR
jgi:hypothetical protein